MRLNLCFDGTWSHLVLPNVHLVVPKKPFASVRGMAFGRRESVCGQSFPHPGAPCFFGTSRCDWSSPSVSEARLWPVRHLFSGVSPSFCETLSFTLTSMPRRDGLKVTSLAAIRDIPKSEAISSPCSAVKRSYGVLFPRPLRT